MPLNAPVKRLLRPLATIYSNLYNIHSKIKRNLLNISNECKFASVGEGLCFDSATSYLTYDKIAVGKEVFIGHSADFRGLISVGDHVMFGPYVYITDGRHDYEQVGKYIMDQGGLDKRRIHVEDDCWIGARTMIMRGVTIGEGTVIGGMSVVTKDMPPYTICVGSPCRPIKKRYSDDELKEHYRILGKTQAQADAMIRRRVQLLANLNTVF